MAATTATTAIFWWRWADGWRHSTERRRRNSISSKTTNVAVHYILRPFSFRSRSLHILFGIFHFRSSMFYDCVARWRGMCVCVSICFCFVLSILIVEYFAPCCQECKPLYIHTTIHLCIANSYIRLRTPNNCKLAKEERQQQQRQRRRRQCRLLFYTETFCVSCYVVSNTFSQF